MTSQVKDAKDAKAKPAMTPFHQRSVRLFGNFSRTQFDLQKLHDPLMQSRIGLRAEAYVSYVIANTLIVGAGTLAFITLPGLVVLPLVGLGLTAMTVTAFLMAPLLFASTTFMALYMAPKSKAKSRCKDIDNKLPYALNYVAAMASAGVIPTDIFRSLSKQEKIYGEIAVEARYIYKDIRLHGIDIVKALKRASARSPSQKWKELLTGAITTVTSGGDLTVYFSNKAKRHMWENRQDQKSFLEVMGLMAETYVTAAVAGPLFLIVMLSIMTMMTGGGPGLLSIIIYFLLPVVNAAFVFGIMNMIPEV